MRIPKIFLLLSILFLAFAGCGKARTGAIPAKEEAVNLMDTRQNSKAARVLEDLLAENPDDDEARLLLASAYMGLADIDVYRIFDAFQDILFRKSLKDQVITPSGGAEPQKKKEEIVPPELNLPKTKAETAFSKLDESLASLQKVVLYLNRFPQVDDKKWPLIEAALGHLEAIKSPTADVFTYRILIRLIYVKSYLVSHLLRNQATGTREWACGFNAQDFNQDLGFFSRHAAAIDEELLQGAAVGSKSLGRAHKNFTFLSDAVIFADSFSTWSEGLTFSELEKTVKGMFNCKE